MCSLKLQIVTVLTCLTIIYGTPFRRSSDPYEGPSALKQRIINGEIVDISLHPHQVSLQYLFFGVIWFHLCGGSIIGRDLVLTAAHCVDYNQPESFRVVINDHTLFDEWTGEEQIIGVDFIFPHEEFTNGINEYDNLYPGDVAVLKLSQNIQDESSLIQMDSERIEDIFVGDNCKISGWGVTESGSSSPELREANMTVLTNEECNEYYPPYIYPGHVCIFNGEDSVTGASACNGDSGGPLVCDGKLVGVTSWGIRNCRLENGSFVPSVYARVSYFHGWIETQLQKFSIGRG